MKIKFFLLSFLIFIFTACGYRPTSYYTKNVFGEKIYIDTLIDLKEPENLVILKDSLNEAVVSKFKGKIVTKNEADTILNVRLKNVSFSAISYDDTGFAVLYKNIVTLEIKFKDKNQKPHTIDTTGDYFFYVNKDSVITDQQRFTAIKIASQKALDYFISKASMIGFLNESK